MQIIPAINCQDLDCVKARFSQAAEIFSDFGSENRNATNQPARWVHLDIADGGFTKGYTTWRNPEDLKNLKLTGVKIEAHLMVNNPEDVLESWLAAGIDRIIVHLSATQNLNAIVSRCVERQTQIFLAVEPAVPITHVLPYLSMVTGCQILAVNPGLSGQQFDLNSLEKIKAIKMRFPAMPVEVDGGINLNTAKICKEAGANILVAGSAIFNSSDPTRAFEELSTIN